MLDWSYEDVISIALDSCIYLFKNKGKDNGISKLTEVVDNFYCAIKFAKGKPLLAAGDDSGSLHIFDVHTGAKTASLKHHNNRVCALSWMNDSILSSGSRDGSVKTIDLRTKTIVSSFDRHTQEVTGLRWAPQENFIASGGNDNYVYVWDVRRFGNKSNAAPRV